MPVSNRYPKPKTRPRSSPNVGPTRRPIAPYRPTRPFSWTPPIREPGKFPGLARPAIPPFGRRAVPPGVLAPVMGSVSFRWALMALRLYPWLSLGLLAWELWNLYKSWNPPTGGNFCRDPSGGSTQWWWTPHDHCYASYSDAGFSKEWSDGRPYLHKREYLIPGDRFNVPLEYTGPYTAPIGPSPLPDGEIVPEISPYMPPMLPWPLVPWEPIAVPPFAPQPIPVPRPRWVPQRPNPEAAPGPPFSPPVDVGPDPSRRPRPVRAPRPRPEPLPEPIRARPPGRGVKERKLQGSARSRKLLGLLLSGASEGFDLLDALHDALPKEFRAKADHPNAKFLSLYQNWDKVDMNEAFENIWRNQAEDRYFGQKFGEMQDALSEAGLDFPMPRDIGGQFTHIR